MKISKKNEALNIIETSYLASLSSLLWVALYYLPIGGALLRLILPLPIILLHLRRGTKTAFEGLIIQFLLLLILMGPVRGTLFLFPYGILAFWLGWCWFKEKKWWLSWTIGVIIGTLGFFLRVFALSTLVGDNLWVIITRASYSLLDKLIDLFNLPFSPSISIIQLVAILLIVFQEMVYVLTIHILAYSLFPRLKSYLPAPPRIINGLVNLDL
tara:strand:- start:1174 stop:1812 length:639 start_codon:yes stop_codon:yes gene_type:complete